LAIDSTTLDTAVKLVGAHAIRAYDAIQLAGAIRLRAEYERAGLPPPIFVSSDQALNRAASAEGMVVEDPTVHP
jgi:predicted nucleic acid-binding protein